jgi:predicted ATP-grasp superfamily ATP-dependent carboligase
MPFIQRDAQAKVQGCFAQRQPGYAEEFLELDSPEVVAFFNPAPDPRKVLDAQETAAAKVDATILQLVNATPAQLMTFARNNFPSLTLAEQNRIGMILNILAVAVRPQMR